MDRDEKKKTIYNLMMGVYDNKQLPKDAALYVQDVMAPGTVCEELYAKVYEANKRVCDKLGVEEDADIEIIINSLLQISEQASLQMYDYGSDSELLNVFDLKEWREAFEFK